LLLLLLLLLLMLLLLLDVELLLAIRALLWLLAVWVILLYAVHHGVTIRLRLLLLLVGLVRRGIGLDAALGRCRSLRRSTVWVWMSNSERIYRPVQMDAHRRRLDASKILGRVARDLISVFCFL
jgi:hypothetical protein